MQGFAPRARWRRIGLTAAFVGAQVGVIAALPATASAETTYTVTTTDDEFDPGATVATPLGAGLSLREAIGLASTDADDSVIELASGATYTLDICAELNSVVEVDDLDHDPSGDEALTINGNGSTIQQTCESRVLRHNGAGALTLDDVTITGGFFEGFGGGIYTEGPTTLQNGTIVGENLAVLGGGVFATDNLTITGGSSVSTNAATSDGGGVYVGSGFLAVDVTATQEFVPLPGVLTIEGSTIDGNCAGFSFGLENIESISEIACSGLFARGGGVYSSGRVMVSDSSITNNVASGDGGGIYQNGVDEGQFLRGFRSAPQGFDEVPPTVTVTNSTITGNEAGRGEIGNAIIEIIDPLGGGGINTTGLIELTNATVAANSSPIGGAQLSAVGLDSFGSVLAYSEGSPNCSTISTTDMGFNYSTDESCGLSAVTTVENGADPQLGPLADNGGDTLTHLPDAATSPLVDGIASASCSVGPAADQRGVERPQGVGCDIGAVEVVTQVVSVDVVALNDDNGSAVAGDFTIEVYDSTNALVASGTDPEPGTGNASAEFVLPVGDYTFGVSGPDGYDITVVVTVSDIAPVEMIDDPSAQFSMGAGQFVEAIITADDVTPPTTTTTTTTTAPATTTTTIPLILPPTGADEPASLALIAALLTLLGAGAAFATRRR